MDIFRDFQLRVAKVGNGEFVKKSVIIVSCG